MPDPTPNPQIGRRVEVKPFAIAARSFLRLVRDTEPDEAVATDTSSTQCEGLPLVLDARDEKDLCINVIKDNCSVSRNLLVRANLTLVADIVRSYEGRGLTHDELVRHATHGLHNAINSFDPAQGIRLSTCATWWIKQSIKQAIAELAQSAPHPA